MPHSVATCDVCRVLYNAMMGVIDYFAGWCSVPAEDLMAESLITTLFHHHIADCVQLLDNQIHVPYRISD